MPSSSIRTRVLLMLSALAFGVAGLMYLKLQKVHSDLVYMRLQHNSIMSTSNGFKVRLALEERSSTQLKEALKAANELNGRLRSAVKVVVQQSTIHDTINAPIVGNRVVFEDSSSVGKLVENIAVFPDTLNIDWLFIPYPITVTVGEVTLRNGKVAFIANTSNGQIINLEAPFADPIEPVRALNFYLGSGYNMIGKSLYVEGGVRYKMPVVHKLFVSASSTQDLSSSGQSRFNIGIVKTF